MAVADHFKKVLPRLNAAIVVRRAVEQKHDMSTKVDRAREKKAADREDARKLAVWAKAVKLHDKYTDRYDEKPVNKTSDADPRRAEAHHIEPRSNWDVRYDPRNGLTVSWSTHERIERGELQVIGTHWFMVKRRRYINGRFPVRWKVVE